MKNKLLTLFFFVSLALFCSETLFSDVKRVSEIKNLKFFVEEESKIENSFVKTEYWLTILLPDKMRKEIVFPPLNRGETYTYFGKNKKIYLPFFNQSSIEEISPEENRILEFIKEMIKRDLDDKEFQNNYYTEKIKIFNLKNSEKIEIISFQKVEGYLLPKEVKIFLGNSHISTLRISSIETDIAIDKKEFDF